jgi:hypothetical protein
MPGTPIISALRAFDRWNVIPSFTTQSRRDEMIVVVNQSELQHNPEGMK